MKYGFGVDIGGTNLKFGYFSRDGKLLESWSIPTDVTDNGSHILPDIAREVRQYIQIKNVDPESLVGIGVGVPGPVREDGLVLRCVNLGWGIINVEEELSALTGLRVEAGNDANVAALGEMWQGGGAGHSDLVMVTLGTGVGGGIVLGGKILAGVHGAAGELGHIHMKDDEEEACGCGNHGCLEQYASGSGIARKAMERLPEYKGETALRLLDVITAKDIFDYAALGDEYAKMEAEDLCRTLGKACAAIACVIDPEIFVIGGGVSKAGAPLLEGVQRFFREYAFHACRDTKFALASLGSDAGIYGCFRLLLD